MTPEIIPYYVEINLLSLVLLFIINFNISKRTAYFHREIYYRAAVIATAIAIICDGVATFLEGAMYPGSIAINWTLDIIYFISSLLIPYLFLAYVHTTVKPSSSIFKPIPFLISLPFYIYSILTILSIKTGWVFTINELNQYSRGPLRVWHSTIGAAVLAFTMVYSIVCYIKHLLPDEVKIAFIVLPIFPLIGVIVRNLLQGSNIIWTSMTIGLLIIFVKGQNSLITIDPLTKLNNRGCCSDYLEYKASNLNGHCLYCTIIDLNYFKHINDTFGHLEGDRALKAFSKALQSVCHNSKDFIARFGGDEFVLISERAANESPEDVLVNLQKYIDEFNSSSNLEYNISFSYGTSCSTPENRLTADELFSISDQRMYEAKLQFHNENETVIK